MAATSGNPGNGWRETLDDDSAEGDDLENMDYGLTNEQNQKNAGDAGSDTDAFRTFVTS
ncbi:MAG: hypothetical protein WCZ66_11820 [Sphingomonadaceae bacterium]